MHRSRQSLLRADLQKLLRAYSRRRLLSNLLQSISLRTSPQHLDGDSVMGKGNNSQKNDKKTKKKPQTAAPKKPAK
jgi:hypothetical protein